MAKHIYADLMMQYAQDAMETEAPWLRWEFRRVNYYIWSSCKQPIQWNYSCEYRRKPKKININGFDVPEPMREAPKIGTRFYFVSFTWRPDENHVDSVKWDGGTFDMTLLKSGVCHLTAEAAGIHAKALLSFTEQK